MRNELPAELARLVVASGRIAATNSTEQRTDFFVIDRANLREDLEEWIGCLGGGGETIGIDDAQGKGIARFVDGNFVAATEWSTFEPGDPVLARSFKLEDPEDQDYWVLEITGFDVTADPCPFSGTA